MSETGRPHDVLPPARVPAAPDPRSDPTRRLIPIGRFFGVPLFLAPSWLVVAAVITVGYADLVRRSVDGLTGPAAYVVAFGYSVALAFCVLLHELGHTAVSLRLGNPVQRVIIFLLGGVSEIGREPDRARDEFLVSVSGPLVSLLLGGAAWGGAAVFGQHTVPWLLCLLLSFSNLVIAVFNLLPGLPLDGGRVLRSAVWAVSHSSFTGTRVAAWGGRVISVAIMLAVLFVNPGRLGISTAVIAAMLSAFIWAGATQSLRAAELGRRLPELSLRRLLRRGIMVPPDMSVALAVRQAWEARANGLVVVDSLDRPTAIVEESKVRALPPQQQPWTPVSQLARPLGPGTRLPIDLDGQRLLDAVRRTPAPEYLVVDQDGRPAGILATTDLAAVLRGRPA